MTFIMGMQSGISQKVGDAPPSTNLDVARELAGELASQIGDLLVQQDSGSVLLSVYPKESAWYVEDAIRRGLAEHRLHVIALGQASYIAEFGLRAFRVEYSDIRRVGWFGSKIMNRRVTLQLTTRVVDTQSGAIIGPSELTGERVDTIAVSDLGMVENPNLPATRGRLPEEGLFANVVEPLIAVGAIAVAVFLLFHVRS